METMYLWLQNGWKCDILIAARVSPTPLCHLGRIMISTAHSISTPSCVNNTSCNQLKVVLEPEIHTPRDKEWQCEVGTFELLAVWECESEKLEDGW